MVFYADSLAMRQKLESVIINLTKQGRPELKDRLSVSWLLYKNGIDNSPNGTAWAAQRLFYPSNLVDLFYGVAIEAWIQNQWLEKNSIVTHAIAEIADSISYDAIAIIIDLLTGTNSGPKIHGEVKQAWFEQRQLINQWLRELEWSELIGINLCQKIWSSGPFGRERQFCGLHHENHNRLSTGCTIRFLHMIMNNSILSPSACQRIRKVFRLGFDQITDDIVIYIKNENSPNSMIVKDPCLSKKRGIIHLNNNYSIVIALDANNMPNMIIILAEQMNLLEDKQLIPSLIAQLID